MKHAHSIRETFEYFCQKSSKSITIILSYTVSNLVRFLRHSVVSVWLILLWLSTVFLTLLQMPYISVQYGSNLPWSCCYSYVFFFSCFYTSYVFVCLRRCVCVCVRDYLFVFYFLYCVLYIVCYLSVNKVFFINFPPNLVAVVVQLENIATRCLIWQTDTLTDVA